MKTESNVQMISIELIIPNRFQPRLTFDEQALNDLANSIKEHGVIQPLVLRKIEDKYEIIAGERRYKAATIAGLTEVPAIISNLDDNQSAEVALVENVQRRNLTSIEEAKSYKRILDKGYLTQEGLAQKMGISQPSIANKLRLLNLTEEVQAALMNEKISERHARSLLQITDDIKQKAMLERVVTERMTVRQLDEEIKKEISPDISERTPAIDFSSLTQDNINLPLESVEKSIIPHSSESAGDSPLIEDVQLETLDDDLNSEKDIEEIKSNTVDIIPNLASKVKNIFDQPEYPSLEDEVVNMNIDNNPFAIGNKDEKNLESNIDLVAKEEASDLEMPEETSASIVVQAPPVAEKRIKANNIPSVTAAYKKLEEEILEVGYKVSTEEFDFEDLYQIIIKIDKQAE